MNTLYSRLFGVVLLTWTFLFFSAEALPTVSAQTITFQNGPGQAAFIELFSSEGCSSCPPAEDWLNTLKNSPELWKEFVPVCFHVDYWDQLGWPDPLASPAYTQRQRVYVNYWKSKSLATPGFVVNGKDWKKWFENPQIPNFQDKNGGILKVEVFGNGAFAAIYEPPSTIHSQWLVHAALLGFGIESDVTAGENAGKKLLHHFAVLDYQQNQLLKIDGAFRAPINLRSKKKIPVKRYAIAVWVTRDNSLIPVQAAGGFLPSGS